MKAIHSCENSFNLEPYEKNLLNFVSVWLEPIFISWLSVCVCMCNCHRLPYTHLIYCQFCINFLYTMLSVEWYNGFHINGWAFKIMSTIWVSHVIGTGIKWKAFGSFNYIFIFVKASLLYRWKYIFKSDCIVFMPLLKLQIFPHFGELQVNLRCE